MSFVWGKSRKPAHGSATQVTEINTLDQIIRKVIDVSRTHIPHSGHLMNDSLERCEIERCSVSEPLNAAVNDDVWKESRHGKCKITKQKRHKRISDRETSRN